MIRAGIVDFDTSHVVAFTQRLNHVDISEEQWVDGVQVVLGCPGTSRIYPERIPEYTAQLQKYGVELVDRPEDLLGQVDAVFVESQDGSVHLERARPFLKAGLPTFVDKPFVCSLADAQEMARLAREHNAPLFSSSSLRYALEVQDVLARREEIGKIVGADAYSPASLHPRNPGLFHYGIHAVETLYALMGPGCEEVWCIFEEGAEVVVGRWQEGRIGTVRGTRTGAHSYGFTAFGEKKVVPATISTAYIYRELLKRVVEMFQTGKPPLDIAETIEIVAFIEAAKQSAENGGVKVPLAV
ncbi:MAG TPA: Gfo/Idh/MocA family oxidoreductase [Armatimonadetes bacterium]|nr:Gfo/Idh/MocA family oxidoreductase [Armatimonadota bacterium]